jgi:oligopeptide/dipeptide ABC transporter ATP-binding protein
MYAGQLVEQGTLSQIVRSPVHPYPKGLLASTVHGAKRGQRLETIPGTPPSLDRLPASCSFAPRCSLAQPRCTEQLPPNVAISLGHTARCVLADPMAAVAATYLGRPDHLLGLMRIERAGARDPALGQDLHRKQLGVDFRFEGAGGAHHAGRVFVRFVRTKSNVPNIALSHG